MKTNKKATILLVLTLFIFAGLVFAFTVVKFDDWRVKESNILLIESQNISNEQEKLINLQKAALLNPNEETYLKAGILAEYLGLHDLADSYLKRVKTAEGFYQLGLSYLGNQEFEKAKNAFTKAISKDKKVEYYLAIGKSELGLNQIGEAREAFKASKDLNQNEENKFYYYLTSLMLDEPQNKPDLAEFYKQEVSLLDSYKDKGNRVNLIYGLLNTLNYPQTADLYLTEQEQRGNLNRDGYLLLAKHYLSINDYANEYKSLLEARTQDLYYPQTYSQLSEVAKLLGKSEEAKNYQDFYNKLTF